VAFLKVNALKSVIVNSPSSDVITSQLHGAEPFFEKPPVVQLLKNLTALYGTSVFITVFKRALNRSLF
jgi:hypothetical protein